MPTTRSDNQLESLEQFVASLYEPDDVIELRRVPVRDKEHSRLRVKAWCSANELTSRVEWLEEGERHERHLFIGVNPRLREGVSGDAGVAIARCLYADLDDTTPEQAKTVLAGFPVPTLLVNSGHGVHAYWRLVEPIEDLTEWCRLQKQLAEVLGSDRTVKNPERMTRLPGFMNAKPPAARACILDADRGRIHELSIIRDAISTNGEADTPGTISAPKRTIPAQSDASVQAAEYLAKVPGAIEGASGDDTTYKVACVLVQDFGLSVSGALPLMLEWNKRCEPPWGTAQLRTKLENARRYAKEPRGLRLNKHIKGSGAQTVKTKGQSEWEDPVPLVDFHRPPFPTPQSDDQLADFWDYCARVAESIQTPLDLPVMLCLTVASAAIAKKAIIHVRGDHKEPLNIFSCVVLDPAHRKSAIFSEIVKPLFHFEAEEHDRLQLLVEENQSELEILEKSLKHTQAQAAKCKGDIERSVLRAEAKELVGKITDFKNSKLLKLPTLIVDDVTPEALTRLLNDNAGKLAIMSAEGGLFGMMAGRYNDSKIPNLDVYLKSHVGDTVKIHRIGRPDEYVRNPALTIGLTVQFDVLRSLSVQPSFRGRGLLGRFFYSLPHSSLGRRQLNPRTVPEFARQQYQGLIRDVLKMDLQLDADGKASPHVFVFSPEAQSVFDAFAVQVEVSLADGGKFEHMRDWAGKLVGGVARIAGVLHGLQFARSMVHVGCKIDEPTTTFSIEIGKYLAYHAKAAYAEIGADPEIDLTKKLLTQIRHRGVTTFSKRDAFHWLRRAVSKSDKLDQPLAILIDHGYIRRMPPKTTKGRPTEIFNVNPRAQKAQKRKNDQH